MGLFKKGPEFKKGTRVIILSGRFAGRVAHVTEDSPLTPADKHEISVVLEDIHTDLGINTIVKINSAYLLKKNK